MQQLHNTLMCTICKSVIQIFDNSKANIQKQHKKQLKAQIQMLFIVYKPLDPRKPSLSSPFLLQLTHQLLCQPISSLKQTLHSYLHCHLSPFISSQNISLMSKSSLQLKNEYPLYMYINPSNYMQQFICTIKANKNQGIKSYTRGMIVVWNQYHKKQTIIRKDDKHKINQVMQGKDVVQYKQSNPNNNNNNTDENTNKNTNSNINNKSNKKVDSFKQYNVIINGKKLIKGKDHQNKQWADLISDNWQQLINNNQSVYIKLY